jgi:hypothetical protein
MGEIIEPVEPEDPFEDEGVTKKKKDEIEELFGDEDEDEQKRKKKKHKDELDEIYEQSLGNPDEDIYASAGLDDYDDDD